MDQSRQNHVHPLSQVVISSICKAIFILFQSALSKQRVATIYLHPESVAGSLFHCSILAKTDLFIKHLTNFLSHSHFLTASRLLPAPWSANQTPSHWEHWVAGCSGFTAKSRLLNIVNSRLKNQSLNRHNSSESAVLSIYA